METLNSKEIKETLTNVEAKLKNAIRGYVSRYADLTRTSSNFLVTQHYYITYDNGVVINDRLMVKNKEKGCCSYLYSMSVTELFDVLSELEETYTPKRVYTIQITHDGITEHSLYQREQTAKVELDELANKKFAELKAIDDKAYIRKEYDREDDMTESDMREEYGRDFVEYPISAVVGNKYGQYTFNVIAKLMY